MNKYLLIGVLAVLGAGAIYWMSGGIAPTTEESQSVPVSTSAQMLKADTPNTPVGEKPVDASHPTVQSSSASLSSVTSITVEHTQNAVDFNAPGAGTAQQKADAAAAANKAYQESKQQGH